MNRGKAISEKTKFLVWGKAAGRCEFKNCGKRLDEDLISGQYSFNSAYLAHIIASSPDGPRGHITLSHALSDDPSNIMLMCDTHHRVIDQEAEKYPTECLEEMKHQHEAWVEYALSSGSVAKSHILQFSAPIGSNETAVPFDDCVSAIMPKHYPAEGRPIEIKVKGMHYTDKDPNYWQVQPDVLRNDFNKNVKGRLENGEIRHLSVFGFAPIPLLVELGRLISDISDATIYERHREPTAQWKWPNDGADLNFGVKKTSKKAKNVALKLCITSAIADERITAVFDDEVAIWEIYSDIQKSGALRHESDLSAYREVVRQTFDAIKNEHGMDVILSVFPAIPVSCAIEFGRVWQPKAHPSFDIYDQVAEAGFVKRLRIE